MTIPEDLDAWCKDPTLSGGGWGVIIIGGYDMIGANNRHGAQKRIVCQTGKDAKCEWVRSLRLRLTSPPLHSVGSRLSSFPLA